MAAALVGGTALAQPAKDAPKKSDAPAKVETPAKVDAPANPTKDAKDVVPPVTPAAPEVTLKVGDDAPPIKVHTWVKGKEVKSFQKGKVYVVEFWATWCPPCRESIPHLTEFAKKHSDVTIIGVAASERKETSGSDQRLTKLKQFVKQEGDNIGYTIAFDNDRKMGTPWMRASGSSSIPTAFVVDGESKISWIGHPSEIEQPVMEALAKAKPGKGADKKSSEKKTPKKSG